jgi:hypothetical protein
MARVRKKKAKNLAAVRQSGKPVEQKPSPKTTIVLVIRILFLAGIIAWLIFFFIIQYLSSLRN